MPNGEENLTPEEEEALKAYLDYPTPEEKQNIFTYFKKVIEEKHNVKTANLLNEELGLVKLPARTNLGISQYCKSMGMKGFSEYFKEEAQILLGTSLSREGFLDKLAVTQKRESEVKTRRPPTTKKGFFGKKKTPEEEMSFY